MQLEWAVVVGISDSGKAVYTLVGSRLGEVKM